MHLIKHTTALLYAISLSIAASTASAQQAGSSLPNVVFIFADDLGVGNVAFYHDYTVQSKTDLDDAWGPYSNFQISSGSTRSESFTPSAQKRFYRLQSPAKANKTTLPLNP